LTQNSELRAFVRGKIARLDQSTPWARGMCAKLRRGIGKSPGELPELWEITLADAPEAWDGKGGVASFEQNAVHTALTLYALHRQGKEGSMSLDQGDSLGGAAARLVEPDRRNLEAVKRRFDAVVTAAGFLELAYHARSIVQLLKGEGIRLDYPRFATDLYHYQFLAQSSRVRLRWGQDFYGVLSKLSREEEKAE
jgi:CRISPR system Cascade subunit CasB